MGLLTATPAFDQRQRCTRAPGGGERMQRAGLIAAPFCAEEATTSVDFIPLFMKQLLCPRVCVLSRSAMSDPLHPYGLYVGRQVPPSMGFSRQEHGSGLPFPPPGDLSDPGVKPTSPVSPALAGGFFTCRAIGKIPCPKSAQHCQYSGDSHRQAPCPQGAGRQ